MKIALRHPLRSHCTETKWRRLYASKSWRLGSPSGPEHVKKKVRRNGEEITHQKMLLGIFSCRTLPSSSNQNEGKTCKKKNPYPDTHEEAARLLRKKKKKKNLQKLVSTVKNRGTRSWCSKIAI